MRAVSVSEPSLSLLLVEDDRADALLVEDLIADTGLRADVRWAPSIADAEGELVRSRPDCVLLDMNLPDASGLAALRRVTEHDPTLPIVVLTGLTDEHFGVSAVSSGAQDYLVKGRVAPDMLQRALLYAIERKRAQLTAVELRASELKPARTPASNVVCCRLPCFWRIPVSRSSPATGRAGRTRCSAGISMMPCRPRTARSTS
jgi:DNA-binding response OmpR family regulator